MPPLPPALRNLAAPVQAFLAGPAGVPTFLAIALLALLLLALWLRARGGGGGGGALQKQLKAAQNENKLLRGDAVQKEKEHAASLAKLNEQVENLSATVGGREPPKLVEWRQRAQEAEAKLQGETARLQGERDALVERHRKEVEFYGRLIGLGSSKTGTVTGPGVQDVFQKLEGLLKELDEVKAKLETADDRHQQALRELTDRLNDEKAAALTAQTQRHQAELERALSQGAAATPRAPVINLAELDASRDVPEHIRFPYLEPVGEVDGEAVPGGKRFLPYGTTKIGRDPGKNDFVIEDLTKRVSSRHATVEFDGADFVLRDDGSVNGTKINGKKVTTAKLAFGDTVSIGDVRQFRFGCAAADAARADAALGAKAYEAMLRVAPTFHPALAALADLLARDPARAEEARQIRERIEALGPAAG